ncbi:polyketide cyclase [Gordonia sp. SID5947]|uniref:polyketide cyclase n=1 Tax=Gordonia sp. SID5947 TaxID=2690315 RepID=UPI0013689E23|nr:polyketide cyclase [Gordonia sp. SID5947]MYR08217.1 polyketide cyclase [Gordonia sp. SID5947]
MNQDIVIATATVAAPVAEVFALLANPSTHPAIDGTGWVKHAVDEEPLTELGQIFRMDMYHSNPEHPDPTYQMANQIQVLDPPSAIGWRPGMENESGHVEFGGWVWRYDLVALGPSETAVTLTYDWSAVPENLREHIQFPPFGPEHLTNSLRHLSELASPH